MLNHLFVQTCCHKSLKPFLEYLPELTPIYFVSPIAREALSYAQIFPECLSEAKQNKAANPEFPFLHDDAIESGKLKVFEYSSQGMGFH